MSELPNTKKQKVIKQIKKLDSAEKLKGDKITSDEVLALNCNCHETPMDIEVEKKDLINNCSTVLLDKQLEKIHIDSTCLTSRYPLKNIDDAKLEMQDSACKIFYSDDDKRIENHDSENVKVKSCIAGSEVCPSEMVQCEKSLPFEGCLSTLSGKALPKEVRSGPQRKFNSPSKSIQTHCSKVNPPTLFKSQSLDLYNDCKPYNIDQYLHRLPDIRESCTFDSQMQSIKPNTERIEHGQESRSIYPNVPYSPYGSPYGSPRSKRRPPLRESRRISIEKTGSFLQLNQYKLLDQIGQGSYGLVKLAYSEEDSTHYAMKILSKKRLLRQAAFMRRGPKQAKSPLDRVYREIAVLKKLDHPNVVKLVEVLDDPVEDSLYMVFELVKNGEVLSIPTDKPLSEMRAWNVFRDCLLGLEYLHYQKIIHADLKPGNLLVTECGHVKIADLGVCNEFLGEDAIMTNGSTCGTPAFRAPETLKLGKNVYCGRAADVWALGITLYSLVYGNVPFLATSIPLLYDKIRKESVVFPEIPKIESDLQCCIVEMLEKDPSKRITLPQLKINQWVTCNGTHCLPTEEENCCLVQVDDEDINSVVRSIPKLDTLILIKTMLKNHSFGNPFIKSVSGRAPQPGGSRIEKFCKAGRSNSAPGSYHIPLDRESSTECVLPALTEHCSSLKN